MKLQTDADEKIFFRSEVSLIQGEELFLRLSFAERTRHGNGVVTGGIGPGVIHGG